MNTDKNKNFLLLGIIAILTIILVLYVNSWYKQKNNSGTSYVTTILSEITQNDFEDYIMDTGDIIIYLAPGNDITLRSFEKQFVEFIKENGLTKKIIYLNTDKVSKDFFESLKEYYSEDVEVTLNKNANILAIQNRKIIGVLYTENKKINEQDVEEFLERFEVLE